SRCMPVSPLVRSHNPAHLSHRTRYRTSHLRPFEVVMQRSALWIPVACLVVLPSAALLFLILLHDGGHFTYTLDDPYIHLALARNIAFGGYGINPGEPAAPSSSILWPFLLAPFARLPAIFELAPLLLNLLCLAVFVGVLWTLFVELPTRVRLLLV